jgi:hypothetical protein
MASSGGAFGQLSGLRLKVIEHGRCCTSGAPGRAAVTSGRTDTAERDAVLCAGSRLSLVVEDFASEGDAYAADGYAGAIDE